MKFGLLKLRATILFLLFLLVYCNPICSQEDKVEEFRQFVEQADIEYYINKAQERMDLEFGDFSFDFPPLEYSANFDLAQRDPLPLLIVKFTNMQEYEYGDNIYEHLVIDSTLVFAFACMDDNGGIRNVVNTEQIVNYDFGEKGLKRCRNAIKNMLRLEPDLIMVNVNLDFLYAKDGKIYFYRWRRKKSYELNELMLRIELYTLRMFDNCVVFFGKQPWWRR